VAEGAGCGAEVKLDMNGTGETASLAWLMLKDE
jgi:hypothetical protein